MSRPTRPSTQARAWLPRIGVASILAGIVAFIIPATVGAATPSVSMTPSGPWQSGQPVTVAVGPNSVFTPHSRIVVIECADPGGSTANLPKDDSTCDGNTVQGATVLVQPNGSFTVSGYTLYSLPNAVLGEQPNEQPICNATNQCVLFVGQDQNDFTSPKVFSAPFAIQAASTTATTAAPATTTTVAPVSGTSTGTSSTASGGSSTGTQSSSASSQQGTLAFTGPPLVLPFLLVSGGTMLLIGSLGRRWVLRSVP
jgi:hypothetical protein